MVSRKRLIFAAILFVKLNLNSMKNKNFSHVLAIVCGMMLCVASCEKMNLSQENEEANVFLSVGSFEQVPFSATRAAVADVCTRISFLVYNSEGERIRKEDQKLEDSGFGHVAFMLPQGHYYLVVVAHSGEGNPTSTNSRKIAFTNKTGYTDTFLYADSLIVANTDVERSLSLKRIAAMVRFVAYDDIPAKSDSIRFYYTGGSGTFDAAAEGWGVVNSTQVQWYELSHTEKKFEIYTIPHAGDEDVLKVTASTYKGSKSDASIVTEREIVDIPVKRNHITTCRGYLFSPVYKHDVTITVDDDWDSDSIDFYF